MRQVLFQGLDSSSDVGGLIGLKFGGGSVTNSYATGSVSGTGSSSNVGGLIGHKFAGGNVTNSYWDKLTSGQTSKCGWRS